MDQALERMAAAGGDCETVLCVFDLRGFGYATPALRFRYDQPSASHSMPLGDWFAAVAARTRRPANADIPFLVFFVDVIFKYFPKRISQVLLVEPPFVFQPVWQVVKPLLGKYQSLVQNVQARELADYLGPDATL